MEYVTGPLSDNAPLLANVFFVIKTQSRTIKKHIDTRIKKAGAAHEIKAYIHQKPIRRSWDTPVWEYTVLYKNNVLIGVGKTMCPENAIDECRRLARIAEMSRTELGRQFLIRNGLGTLVTKHGISYNKKIRLQKLVQDAKLCKKTMLDRSQHPFHSEVVWQPTQATEQ